MSELFLPYNIINEPSSGEYEEKKSRFIAYLNPVSSEEEALSFINSVKKKHYDARHNCYAFIIGDKKELVRSNDDKEPQGTAGKPILEVLMGEGLTNVVCVVTRYFGGTLLGTGGLIRAYSEAVKEAVKNASISSVSFCANIKIKVSYNDVNNIQYYLNSNGIMILDTEYLQDVTFMIRVKEETKSEVIDKISELTLGKAEAAITDSGYYPLTI